MTPQRLAGSLLLGLGLALLPAAPAAAQTRYIAFGDSITEGFGDEERPDGEMGYPPRLEELLLQAGENAVVENHGEGSETTTEGITRLDDVLREGGDVLLLMEGTNDISRGISLETTRTNLDEMARKAETRGMEAVHATLIPRLPRARFDAENVQNRRAAQRIRHVAGTRERRLVDPFEELYGIPDLFERFYIDGNDPVGHPNPDGYDLLAQIFFDALEEIDKVPPVAGRTTPSIGDTGVPAGAEITVDVWDFGAGIDLPTLTLEINDVAVPAVRSGDERQATLTFDPPQPLAGVVRIGLRARDLATPPNEVDQEILRFTVAGTTFLDGDLTEDGRVDGADLVSLALRFGARRGESRYRPAADFNDDDVIDGEDLAVLSSNFGRSSF